MRFAQVAAIAAIMMIHACKPADFLRDPPAIVHAAFTDIADRLVPAETERGRALRAAGFAAAACDRLQEKRTRDADARCAMLHTTSAHYVSAAAAGSLTNEARSASWAMAGALASLSGRGLADALSGSTDLASLLDPSSLFSGAARAVALNTLRTRVRDADAGKSINVETYLRRLADPISEERKQ